MSDMSSGGFFKEERERWVSEKLKQRHGLTAHQRKLLRHALEQEFSDLWSGRDYVYGVDEGGRV